MDGVLAELSIHLGTIGRLPNRCRVDEPAGKQAGECDLAARINDPAEAGSLPEFRRQPSPFLQAISESLEAQARE